MSTARRRGFGPIFYALIFAASFAVYGAVALTHTHPPYMDSYYYVDIARNLAHGQGLSEGFVWNYLGGLPPLRHPSSEYWLPGLSLLLAPLLALGAGYRGAALATAAMAAACPTLAAALGGELFGRRRQALTMAALTLFNGLWFHDWATPDAFVPFASLATLTFLLAGRALRDRRVAPFALAGLSAGAAALTRQEGLLLPLALALAAATARRAWPAWKSGVLAMLACCAAALAPWLLHNAAVLGTPLAASGSRTLWMGDYDAFYHLYTAQLTPAHYLGHGLAWLAQIRVAAALFTVAVWAAQWLAVLVPPLAVGAWLLRREPLCRPFLIYWLLLGAALPLLFAATLANGTLTHASGALIPFASACVVAGIDGLARALARRRGQDGTGMARTLSIMAVGLAAAVSLGMTWRTFPAHGDEFSRDRLVVSWLHRHNRAGVPVMVVDPPAFAYIDDGAYIVAPSDGLAAARAAARHYGVRFWALDPIHAAAQQALYDGRVHPSWLRRVTVIAGVQVYQLSG